MIKGRTFNANTKGLFSNNVPKTNEVPSAVAAESFSTPELRIAKKLAT